MLIRVGARSFVGQFKGVVRAEHDLWNGAVVPDDCPYMRGVGGLWHLDFHHASRQIRTEKGELVTPRALVHGFTQALQKGALPVSIVRQRIGNDIERVHARVDEARITHETTLPYSPYQNGKQESFGGYSRGA